MTKMKKLELYVNLERIVSAISMRVKTVEHAKEHTLLFLHDMMQIDTFEFYTQSHTVPLQNVQFYQQEN